MPQMAQAVDMPVMNNTMSGCGKMDQTEHFTAPKNASTDSIALCCVAKRENSDAGYLSFNDWAPSEASQQNVSVDIVNNNNFGNQLILENYPISPPPADLLSSVIKIE